MIRAGEECNLFYFMLSLLLSLAISGILLAGLIKSLQINWERKNRRPVGYLTPVILTLVFIGLTTYLTVPRLLDTVSLMTGNYMIEEIKPEQAEIRWSTLVSGDRQFFFNQWLYKPEAGKSYRISYTPYSRYIVEMAEVAETAAGSK